MTLARASRFLAGLCAGLCLLSATTLGGGARPAQAAGRCGSTNPLVVNYRIGAHRTFDRIVFQFRGGVPGANVKYEPHINQDASGAPVPLLGHAFLSVVFAPAIAVDVHCRSTAAEQTATPRLHEIRQVKPAGDFEGHVSFGIGVARRSRDHLFRVYRTGRAVLDIHH